MSNSITMSVNRNIPVVANFSALPAAATSVGEYYWVETTQGTAWLPGTLGGTYYPKGLYYSNGVIWSFMESPSQATQVEVDAGTNTDKFLTPETYTNSTLIQRDTTPTDGSTNLIDSNAVFDGLAGKLDKHDGATYDTNALQTLTAAEYAAIGTPNANTLYFIV